MEDGELRFASSKTAAGLNERIKELSPIPASKEKVKLYDWIDTYLKVYVEPLRKASTHKQYKDTAECYIKPNIPNRYVKNIKKIDIQNIIAKLTKKGLSANTMKQVLKVLNLLFNQAIEDKITVENPVEEVEIPGIQQKPRKTLKIEELNRIFEYLKNSRWYWPIHFMLYTGLRRGELLGLKWSDIDEKQYIITVADNLTDEGIGSTKENKVHYVPLSNKAARCLEEFKKQLKKENNPAYFRNDTDIIFVSQKGKPLRPHSLNNVFRRIQDNLDIQASPHSMRHSFVYYNKNKLSLSELKDALGHEETTSTLDIYGTMLTDAKNVAKKIDETYGELENEMEEPEKKKIVGSVVSLNDFRKRK